MIITSMYVSAHSLSLSKSSKFWIAISVLVVVAAIIFLSKKVDKTILIIDHVTVEKESDIKSITDSLVVPILYRDVVLLNKLNRCQDIIAFCSLFISQYLTSVIYVVNLKIKFLFDDEKLALCSIPTSNTLSISEVNRTVIMTSPFNGESLFSCSS